ncbi:3-ketoacyl-CoA thiolase 5, peroxisomal-like [Asparagus officinalis]|uniref:3-ketoacyl-CoA thiolase 5, peroxisomal-like n=1 Tax=Asparagus officinalis TaxID=4686 RepID=UPI00098DFF34|nr:3-ketoacyl-CoA thiolase 5, peroxisomal-like [Asparagus officinalis]
MLQVKHFQAQDCLLPTGITSENAARRFGVTRQEQDQAAVESHQKAAAATASGKFKDEIVPVMTKVKVFITSSVTYISIDIWDPSRRNFLTEFLNLVGEILLWYRISQKVQFGDKSFSNHEALLIVDPKSGEEKQVTISVDDGIRPETAVSSLAKLKPVFKKDGSTTAVSDGAGAVLLMRRDVAMRKELPIPGIFRSFVAVGVDPAVTGIGPAAAIPPALKSAGLQIEDIDLFEINEANDKEIDI